MPDRYHVQFTKDISYLQDDTNDNLGALAFQNDVCNVEGGMIVPDFFSWFFVLEFPPTTNMRMGDVAIRVPQANCSCTQLRSKQDG